MRSDLLYSFRTLLRDRGYAAAVVLSLAVGIGANTAMFSLLDAVVLRALPFREPDRLVNLSEVVKEVEKQYPRLPVNAAHFYEWRKQSRSFEQLALYDTRPFTLSGGSGDPELVKAAAVTASMFRTLAVAPALGREFREEEDEKGRDTVVILSDALWRRRFAGDPAVLGRKVMLDGAPYDVVGVMPRDFRLPVPPELGSASHLDLSPDVLKPLGWTKENLANFTGEFNFRAIGRIRTGIPIEAARAELDTVQAGLAPRIEGGFHVRTMLTPLQDAVTERVRTGLWLLMAAVAAVLLILCVNLANLSIVRAVGRRRDFAIRTALGAGKAQILRHLIVESVLLAFAGAASGLLLAYGALLWLVRYAPVEIPSLERVSIDVRVLAFTGVISVVAAISFGLAPGLRMLAADPNDALKSGSHTSSEGVGGVRIRNLLVASEVALSTVLLIVSGLLLASFAKLMDVDRGFSVERVLSAEVTLPGETYKDANRRVDFMRRVLEKCSSLPGATASGVVSAMPLSGERWVDVIGYENDSRPIVERVMVNIRSVSPGYFEALGVRPKAGRVFDDRDKGRDVVLLSESAAAKVYPGSIALGRKVLRGMKEHPEVVGIVPDLRIIGLDKKPVPMVYRPFWDRPRLSYVFLVRSSGDPRSVAGALRAAVREVDAAVPIPRMKTLTEVVADSVAQRRFQMLLLSVFAAAALALASLGIYGVVSYGVARRRAELAIRMALGASSSQVNRMVVRHGLTPVLIGLAVGTGFALAAGRYIRSLLFEVPPHHPATVSLVLAVLVAVAVLACLVPAIRAGRLEPMRALRCE